MIECTELVKTFQAVGSPGLKALDGLSLSVGRGEVVGVAGPNGAGKSTLIALLLGYLHPTSGTVLLDGVAPRRYVERHGVGYLSELIAINPRWRTDQVLERYALLAGLTDADIPRRVNELIELFGLGEHRLKPIKALSKGNLQRLGVAQALLGDPDLIVLDEPTHGFDPMWTLRFRDIIAGLRRPGRAMLIASHDLAELSALADRVIIIDRGKVVRTVETAGAGAAQAPVRRDYRLTVASGAALVAGIFPEAVSSADGVFEMRAITIEALNAGLAELLRGGGQVVSVGPSESLLEYHFRDAVEVGKT